MDWLATLRDIKHWCDRWGNFASVTGLLVSVVGFALTIKTIITAKDAANRAESAANAAKERILKSEAASNFHQQ